MYSQMGYPGNENWYNTSTLTPDPTGDGQTYRHDGVQDQVGRAQNATNHQMGFVSADPSLGHPAYPVSGLGAEVYPTYYCSISALLCLKAKTATSAKRPVKWPSITPVR